MSTVGDDKPIYSSRADDLDFRDAIDEFVVGLAERVDRFQDAEAHRDFAQLIQLAQSLLREAADNGFEPLSSCAENVAKASQQQDSEATRKQLIELTRIAQRIRRGHRGAV